MSGIGKRKLSICFEGAFCSIAARKIHLITETDTVYYSIGLGMVFLGLSPSREALSPVAPMGCGGAAPTPPWRSCVPEGLEESG